MSISQIILGNPRLRQPSLCRLQCPHSSPQKQLPSVWSRKCRQMHLVLQDCDVRPHPSLKDCTTAACCAASLCCLLLEVFRVLSNIPEGPTSPVFFAPWPQTWTKMAFFFFPLNLFWSAPEAYRDSPARGPIGAIATGLHHSHSSTGSEQCLKPTPQLTTTLDA